MTLWTWNKLV